jgi:hypothetical protein
LLIIRTTIKIAREIGDYVGLAKENYIFYRENEEGGSSFCYCNCIDIVWIILLFTEQYRK